MKNTLLMANYNIEKEGAKMKKTLMERIAEWRAQGLEFGFNNRGYGAFAKGIPASYFYRAR